MTDVTYHSVYRRVFPGGSALNYLPAMQEMPAGYVGLGSGRSPGKGNGNPLQYPCLENPMVKGAWWAMVHGLIEESDMT